MSIPHAAKRIFDDWNINTIGLDRALEHCRQNNISVLFSPHVSDGFFVVYKGVEMIALNSYLDPQMTLWVLLHEIFHSECHSPETSYFSPSMENKNDHEANVFAAVAMMPRRHIEGCTIDEICYYSNIPRQLVNIRMKVADNMKI